MPIYEYEHPETGEIFDDLRAFKDMDKPFIAPDGVECPRIVSMPFIINGSRENDYNDIKKSNPKYVRFKDGRRERFDPTKHCGASGADSSSSKKPFRKKKGK